MKKLNFSPRTHTMRWYGIPLLLLISLGIVIAAETVTFDSPVMALRWLWQTAEPLPLCFTILTIALIAGTLWGLTGCFFLGVLIPMIGCMAIAFANSFQLRVNGVPMEIADFTLAKDIPELLTLSKGKLGLSFWSKASIGGCLALLAAALVFSKSLRRPWKKRIPGFAVCLVLVLCLSLPLPTRTAALKLFGMHPESRIGQSYSDEINGVLGGLYRAWAMRKGTAPKHYSRKTMEALLDELDADSAETGTDEIKPSVILILSEAFFDPTTLPGVEFSQDPVPTFHALSGETVSGTFRTSFCGYNTGIIERSVLTGLHSRYLPYGVNTCYMSDEDASRLTALPQLFRDSGYSTLALHTYNSSLYNRAEQFPLLGFDEVLFQDSFFDETRLKGGYLSDDYFADLIIEHYEEMTAEGDPAFVFGISMENHQPYPADKFAETEISVTAPGLSEDGIATLETVTQGIYDADASLAKLTAYFESREEPVILVFFGDHRPSMSTADGRTVYSQLGLCPDGSEMNWSPEEYAEIYSTCYLAWANYDAFGDTPVDEDVVSGDMLLGSDILNWAGIRQTLYWQLVDRLGDTVSSFTELGYVAADGTAYRYAPEEAYTAIVPMETVLYDTFYGDQYITDGLNRKK